MTSSEEILHDLQNQNANPKNQKDFQNNTNDDDDINNNNSNSNSNINMKTTNDNTNTTNNINMTEPSSSSTTTSTTAPTVTLSKIENNVKEIINQLPSLPSYIQTNININRHKFQTFHNDHPNKSYFILTTATTTTAMMMYMYLHINLYAVLTFLLYESYHLIMRIVGTTLGIGFGLGLAFHIRELLDEASINHHATTNANANASSNTNASSNNHGIGNDDGSEGSQNQNKVLIPRTSFSINAKQSPFQNNNNNNHNHSHNHNHGNSYLNTSNSADSTSSSSKLITDINSNNANNNNNNNINSSININSNINISTNNNNNNTNSSSSSSSSPSSPYHTLMANAGYAIPKNLLRGQIIRNLSSTSTTAANNNNNNDISNYSYTVTNDISKRNSFYSFPKFMGDHDTNTTTNNNTNTNNNDNNNNDNHGKGQHTFNRMWPNLPTEIQMELGTLVDFILRDYVTSWYSFVDSGVQYKDARIQRTELKKEEEECAHGNGNASGNASGSGNTNANTKKKNYNNNGDDLVLNRSTSSLSRGEDRVSPISDIGGGSGDNDTTHCSNTTTTTTNVTSNNNTNHTNTNHTNTTMVLSTAAIRTIPFLEILYTSITALLGNLAMYVGDNINIAELVLIKLVHILKVNIKTYRDMRKAVLAKNDSGSGSGNGKSLFGTGTGTNNGNGNGNENSNGNNNNNNNNNGSSGTNNNTPLPDDNDNDDGNDDDDDDDDTKPSKLKYVSEISIVREYLVQGKLHRAITFGMDVPGLLFGDMNGEECPLPTNYKDDIGNPINNKKIFANDTDQTTKTTTSSTSIEAGATTSSSSSIADEILEKRLFGNKSRLLYECELDYNRVISHRISRILFPRADFTSPVLRSAVVEMLAGCVLTPIMGCATPDYINGFVITSLEDTAVAAATAAGQVDSNEHGNLQTPQGEGMYGGDQDNSSDVVVHDVDVEDEEDDEELTDDDDDIIDQDTIFEDDEATSLEGVESFVTPTNSADITIAPSDISSMGLFDEVLALLSMSLIEIGAHVDFEDSRIAKETGEEFEVDWNDKNCKEVVRNLVLVIESILIHGLLQNRDHKIGTIYEDDSENERKISASQENSTECHSSFIKLLMEITSDLESFENKVRTNGERNINPTKDENKVDDEIEIHLIVKPSMTDLATIRTLIAAWLHAGLVYRALTVLIKGSDEFLVPYYHGGAFILNKRNASAFLRQLRTLHRVDIIVDSTTVLSCPSLDLFQIEKMDAQPGTSLFPPPLTENSSEEQQHSIDSSPKAPSSKRTIKLTKGLQSKRIPDLGLRSIKANFENNKKKLSSFVRVGSTNEKGFVRKNAPPKKGSTIDNASKMRALSLSGNQETPSHLNFQRNEGFAASLRNERETRMKSFLNVFNSPRTSVEMICRSRIDSESHFIEHRDLHNLAKIFYGNTNALVLKSETRKQIPGVHDHNEETANIQATMVLETVSSRRKTSIPEDDSSFLLRAQPSPLDVVSIHRDQRCNSLSYKKYVGYYDEAILHGPTKTDRGGRLRRKCFLRYYPNDRTASITFIQHDRRLDCRSKEAGRKFISLKEVDVGNRPKEFERHPCYKAIRKGTERTAGALANTILASTLMDSADFTYVPRSGKAADFLYRLALFEEPAIELSGKRIIVQDASAVGCHQADASSLDLSDASLSVAMIIGSNEGDKEFYVKCDSHNSPLVFMRVVDNTQKSASIDKKSVSVYKPFRISYVRAALLVASSRKEAQLKCLLSCIRSGSAKKATKARMDTLLQMSLFLLEYATSKKREKQSILLRDLKLGINHVDRDQLRRNGIWNPRYPTKLKQLKIKVEDAVEVKANNVNELLNQSTILYKVRCFAVTEYVGVHNEDSIDLRPDGKSPEYGDLFHEEWIVWRPFRDFTSLHKVLKSIVNSSECSAGTGAKLVGAATGLATAALTIGNSGSTTSSNPSSVKRKILVPSLSQASKVGALGGALGATKKSIEKRKQVLNVYLNHLLAPNNLLNRCPELLRFIGAYDPLPFEVKLDQGPINDFTDSLGRSEMSKSLLHSDSMKKTIASSHPDNLSPRDKSTSFQNLVNMLPRKSIADEPQSRSRRRKKPIDPVQQAMLESVRDRIERVKPSQVRVSIFELMRFTFDLDNASFFRNRLVAALKTMSYAMTSGQGFKKTLLNFHIKYLTGKSIATYIKFVRDKIWPDGVIFTSAPLLNLKEKEKLMKKSSKLLHQAFPDQLSALLGQENTDIGIDILHEMLQNRVVLKSISYQMVDALLLEIFPEIGDVLTCSNILDHVED